MNPARDTTYYLEVGVYRRRPVTVLLQRATCAKIIGLCSSAAREGLRRLRQPVQQRSAIGDNEYEAIVEDELAEAGNAEATPAGNGEQKNRPRIFPHAKT